MGGWLGAERVPCCAVGPMPAADVGLARRSRSRRVGANGTDIGRAGQRCVVRGSARVMSTTTAAAAAANGADHNDTADSPTGPTGPTGRRVPANDAGRLVG
jgi:hypothetical protein